MKIKGILCGFKHAAEWTDYHHHHHILFLNIWSTQLPTKMSLTFSEAKMEDLRKNSNKHIFNFLAMLRPDE